MRGLAAIVGLAGTRFVGGTPTAARQNDLGVLTKGGRLTLKARGLRARKPTDRIAPTRGERISSFAELTDGGGTKIGEFYAVAVSANSPFGPTEYAAAQIEHHVFVLKEGSVVGMGAVPPGGINRPASFAIIGGTGRFEGIRGSYTATQNWAGLGGTGNGAFEFNILR